MKKTGNNKVVAKTGRLEELQEIVAGRDKVVQEAAYEVNKLAQEIEQAQADYALAVSEGDVSQGSKLQRLQKLRKEYQDALIKLEALQESVKQARSSEKLSVLVKEVEAEARSIIGQLDKDKSELITQLEELKAQVLDVGMKILDLEQKQQAFRSEASEAIKKVKGGKYAPQLPGPGHLINRDIPFRAEISTAWREANKPMRKERPERLGLGPASRLMNL